MASVSIVIPTYERVQLLREALDSALAQTFTDVEILIGDNSDSDDTERMLAEHYHDPRIHYQHNRPGLGAIGNWLDLVRRSTAPLIGTLHDDDVWEPDYLATVAPPMLADPSIAMTFNDYWVIDEHGAIQKDYTERESARTHRDELPAGPVHYDLEQGLRLVAVWNAPQPCYAAVIRRDEILATDFPEDIHPLYDIWTSYNLVMRGCGLRYEPRRLTRYRVHSNAGTSDARFTEAEDNAFRHIVDDNAHLPVADEIRRYWSTIRWYRGVGLMGDGTPARARSQQELLAAAEALDGPKKVAALAAGRSDLVWNGLRLVWEARHRRPRMDDLRRPGAPAPTSGEVGASRG